MKRLALLLAMLICAAVSSPALATWREASSDHFLVYSSQSEKDIREFSATLERYHSALGYLYRLPSTKPSPANRVTIMVVSPTEVRKLYGPGAGDIAGFYKPRAGASVAIVPRVDAGAGAQVSFSELVLLHEYAHHFLFQTYGGGFPGWFSEGFAEFFGTAQFKSNGSVGLGLPAKHRGYSLLTGRRVPIEDILAPGTKDINGDYFYGRSWLLTHYLTFSTARQGQLQQYLKLVSTGTGSVDSARQAFGDLAALDKELDVYLRRPRMSYMEIGAAALKPGTTTIRALSAGEEEILPVRIRSQLGVNKDEAAKLVVTAREIAKRHPDSSVVLAALAEAELDAGMVDAAVAAADAALKIDPQSQTALIMKGFSLLDRAASEDEEKANASLRAARAAALAANKIEADDPRPLMLFYFAQSGKPTANAVAGLEHALALAPQDDGLRWTVVFRQLSDNRLEQAAQSLRPLAYSPHPSPQTARARAALEKAMAGSAEEALAALAEQPADLLAGSAGGDDNDD